MLTISLSHDNTQIRITCNDICITCTLAEWSRALAFFHRHSSGPSPFKAA